MPVSDLNALKMALETTNLVSTTEAVTEFWELNPSLVVIFLLAAIALAAFLFIVIFLRHKFSNMAR